MEVNLMSTEITALLSSTFVVALQCIWLPPRLIQIGKEAFLDCVVLQEVVSRQNSTSATVPSAGASSCNGLPSWIGETLNSGCRLNTMPFSCATNLKNLIGWNCSPRKDQILMPLTRNQPRILPISCQSMVDSTEQHCHEYCHANRSDKELNHVYP